MMFVIVMCIVKIVTMFCVVKCPCMCYSMYVHSLRENTFNFIIKILGHILKFFLGEVAYSLFDVNPHLQKNDPD